MLRPVWPELLEALLEETDELTDKLGDDHDLERSVLTVAAGHPVGVHDRDTSRLFTCSWHGANLRDSQFPGGPWNVVKARRRRKLT